jgi:L-rhamnose mutarotase
MLKKKIKNYFIFLKKKTQKKNLYNLNNIHNYNIKLKAIVMSTINKKQKKTTISQTE